MVEYVGLDVSKEETAYCVMTGEGRVLAKGKAASDPDALFGALKAHCLYPERIVVETGTLSHWLVRGEWRGGGRHAHNCHAVRDPNGRADIR